MAPFIAASNRAAIPVNALLPTTPTDASNKDFPESGVSLGSGASVSATITVGWNDGYRADQTATFTAPGPCAQETGSLKLSKTLSGGPAEYTGPFTIGYNCGVGHTGTESVSAGSSKTVSGIPVATLCTVNESLPAAPPGYTFGTPTFVENSGTPNDGIVTITSNGATVEVTTVNTLTRDLGSLTLSKVLSGGPAGYTGPFTINYDCNDGTAHDGSKSVAAGATSSPITGIPTGTQCTVSETPPSAPAGYSFGAPTFSPSATVTISAKDQTVNVQTTNTLTLTPQPPVTPPVTPTPKTDITVTKAATPQVQLPQGGGSAPITYTLVVTNKGPDPAADVKVADAAPVGVTFVSATTTAGTCVVVTPQPSSLSCSLGTMAAGASVSITVNATVNAIGTKTNVVTVTTATPETDSSNNTASAPTVVTAPGTPPTAKPTTPKPTPSPEICATVTVTPKVLQGNGKSQKITVRVTKGTKGVVGVSVKISGPGVTKTVKSGKNGKVTVSFKPTQPGIVKVEVLGTKACNTQRIGVVGTYEPPVTG